MHQEDMICAGSKDKGPNHGDSGGPILVERGSVWYQAGVTSWGNDAHLKRQDEYPTIFSRITTYCEWIEAETEGDAKCIAFDEEVDDAEEMLNGNV
ncbi:serine protease 27-like protein [Aphelenchoides avenae]|nr:serine protease 27-like protein [Aphelenchus avenae]